MRGREDELDVVGAPVDDVLRVIRRTYGEGPPPRIDAELNALLRCGRPVAVAQHRRRLAAARRAGTFVGALTGVLAAGAATAAALGLAGFAPPAALLVPRGPVPDAITAATDGPDEPPAPPSSLPPGRTVRVPADDVERAPAVPTVTFPAPSTVPAALFADVGSGAPAPTAAATPGNGTPPVEPGLGAGSPPAPPGTGNGDGGRPTDPGNTPAVAEHPGHANDDAAGNGGPPPEPGNGDPPDHAGSGGPSPEPPGPPDGQGRPEEAGP